MSRRSPLATTTEVEVTDVLVKPPTHLFTNQKYQVPVSVEMLPPLLTTETEGGGGVMDPRYRVDGMGRTAKVLFYFMPFQGKILLSKSNE